MSKRSRSKNNPYAASRSNPFEGRHPDGWDPYPDVSRPHTLKWDEHNVVRFDPVPDDFQDGARPTTWGESTHGPEPWPDWVITDLGATDTELGVVKTGKEADVYLLERTSQDQTRSVLMAAKRYRGSDHRQFHRDAGYTEGRRVRASREMRAMQRRTEFGKALRAGMWVGAEFDFLGRLWSEGVPVPYPVQMNGAELLMEFIGDDHEAAPRLAAIDTDDADLRDLWEQLADAIRRIARMGLAHGDLSPYNLLVHRGEIVIIDVPQAVDIVINPDGAGYLRRDIDNVADWFVRHGVEIDAGAVFDEMAAEAGL